MGLYLKSGLYRIPVYTWFWFIQGSDLYRVWFRQVSLYIHMQPHLKYMYTYLLHFKFVYKKM